MDILKNMNVINLENNKGKTDVDKDFSKILSEKRIPRETPDSIIDKNGKAVFGTFNREFKDFNFLKTHRQSPFLPDFMNRSRVTLWQACEMNFKEVVLLTAVCKMGTAFSTSLTLLYDKKEKTCKCWQAVLPLGIKTRMSKNLMNGEICSANSVINRVSFHNNLQDGNAHVAGKGLGKTGKIQYDARLERVADPSIVSIPFGKNKPLYTQKDIFKLTGYIKYNDKIYYSDENSTAIIDDHRGFYPYNSHYDWITTMGRCEVNGREQFFGINLTKNQSQNQDDFNENLIWMEDGNSRLTPVEFRHVHHNLWHISDEHGMVDITFDIGDRNVMKLNILGLIKSDYHIVFGTLNGYVITENGQVIRLKDSLGIGEDKTVRF